MYARQKESIRILFFQSHLSQVLSYQGQTSLSQPYNLLLHILCLEWKTCQLPYDSCKKSLLQGNNILACEAQSSYEMNAQLKVYLLELFRKEVFYHHKSEGHDQ